MLELYHFGSSTGSQKVRLVLAEKGLDFVSREVDLRRRAGSGRPLFHLAAARPGRINCPAPAWGFMLPTPLACAERRLSTRYESQGRGSPKIDRVVPKIGPAC